MTGTPKPFGIRLPTELEISDFERVHNIVLPMDLRAFLLKTRESEPQFYWESLQHGLLAVDVRSARPGVSFQWGTADARKAISRRLGGDKDYCLEGDPYREHAGCLPLIHYGCAWIDAIVITGDQRGTVWGGGNCSWYPFHDDAGRQFGFPDWYQHVYLPGCSKLRQEHVAQMARSTEIEQAANDSNVADEEIFPAFRRKR